MLAVCLVDASSHVQVLDGGVPDDAEGGAIIVSSGTRVIDRHGMSITVKGAAEVHVFADAHHLGGVACFVGFLHRDVGHQLEVLAAVVAGAAVDTGAQEVPVFGVLDQPRRIRCAVAGPFARGEGNADIGVGHGEVVIVRHQVKRARCCDEAVGQEALGGVADLAQVELHDIAAA